MERWTRKGQSVKENNTNIDIVASTGFKKDDIKIEVGEYKKKVSDHAPIKIEIKDFNNPDNYDTCKDKVINKD